MPLSFLLIMARLEVNVDFLFINLELNSFFSVKYAHVRCNRIKMVQPFLSKYDVICITPCFISKLILARFMLLI